MTATSEPAQFPFLSQQRLTALRKLATKKGRSRSGEFLIEGVRLVGDVLRTTVKVPTLLVSDDTNGEHAHAALADDLTYWRGETFRLHQRNFKAISDTVHPAGVAAVVHWTPPDFRPNDRATNAADRVVYCDRITDPGNLGTLIRAAAALGVERLFTHPEAVAITNPKTVRASAGAIFRIPIHEGVLPSDVANWCGKRRVPILIADAHRGRAMPSARPRRWMLVIGGETIPLDEIWETTKARRVKLILQNGVESLNSGVAGAILLDRLCRVESPKGVAGA